MEASTYFDIMSYCSPYWISDFTWSALFERIRDINLLYGAETSTLTPVRASLPDTNWHSLVLFEDGSLGWAPDTRMAGEPGGTLRRLEILDHQDRVVGAVQARFSPRAPGPGGLLRFNGSFPDLHKVRLDGVDSPPLTP
jgi:hypothetical protein